MPPFCNGQGKVNGEGRVNHRARRDPKGHLVQPPAQMKIAFFLEHPRQILI